MSMIYKIESIDFNTCVELQIEHRKIKQDRRQNNGCSRANYMAVDYMAQLSWITKQIDKSNIHSRVDFFKKG